MTSDDDTAHGAPTSAGIGPTEETTEVPPPPADADPDLAWPQGEPEPLRQSWSQVWSAAAIVVLCCAVIAMGITVWAMLRSGSSSAPATPHPPTPTTPAAPTSGNTNTDAQFIAALSKAGIRVYDPAHVISAAHIVCDDRSARMGYANIVASAYGDGITDGLTATTFVSDAEESYCPELQDYESQHGE